TQGHERAEGHREGYGAG
ncbi:hypothetical protein BN1708_020131, partial [Verticillium longisporum]